MQKVTRTRTPSLTRVNLTHNHSRRELSTLKATFLIALEQTMHENVADPSVYKRESRNLFRNQNCRLELGEIDPSML